MDNKVEKTESVNENTENKMDKKEKNKKDKKKPIIIILILIIFALLAGGYCGYKYLTRDTSKLYEESTKIAKISQEDRQAAVNQIVEDGMMNVNYQTGATFKGKESTDFKVTNIENNKHPIVFKLMDQDGNEVYKSEKIKQGYECTHITLDKEYKKGDYEWQIVLGYADGESNAYSAFPIYVTFE